MGLITTMCARCGTKFYGALSACPKCTVEAQGMSNQAVPSGGADQCSGINAIKPTILDEAAKIVDGDREATYGHPAKNFETTARLWAPIVGHPLSVQQVALMMIQLKIARQLHKYTRDNLVDIAGYARCIEKASDAGTHVTEPVL